MAERLDRRVIMGWRCLVDFSSLVVIAIVVAVLQTVTPFHRGFFCDDQSIVYPFKKSTVSTVVLMIVGVFSPLLLFALGAYRLSFFDSWGSSASRCELNVRGKQYRVSPCIVHFFHFAFIFILGGMVNQLITDVGKVTIGRLRPNFISVCKPNYTAFNCTDEHGLNRYVLGDFCTGDKSDIEDSRKSWPSGHSSASAYAMVFAFLYIEYCAIFRRMPAARNLANLVFILFAFCTILSRIDDNKHHWSDVLSGALIGLGVALSMFYINFPLRDRSQYLQPTDDDLLPHAMYERYDGMRHTGSSDDSLEAGGKPTGASQENAV
ncbi:phospholipid phosphatase 3-like isoform X2 [Sycon ciliatum]|uniref:phospholipid phosphatase 3-like isoform X2 n=1 Tax=Sycon ciliatum TaxID=27933 RepID=UPI0031F5F7CA